MREANSVRASPRSRSSNGIQPNAHMKTPRPNLDFLRYLGFACLVTVLLALHYVVKHKTLAFYSDDIGTDLYYQFYALQYGIVHQLHTLHYVTWSFDLGLGAFPGLYFNPIQILLTFALPESAQFAARLPIYFLELVLAGSFFLAYLRTVGFEGGFAVLGALCYTFSGFAMLDGQWDATTLQILQLAAFLYFLEISLDTQNRWFAAAAGATVAAGMVFDLYQFALFTLLYLLVPFTTTRPRTLGIRVIALARAAPWMMAGAMLLAIVQIPNLHYIFDSPRVSGGYANFTSILQSIFALNDRATISAEIAGLLGKDLLGSNLQYHGWSNYFEGPGFYIGLLPLISIPQLLAPSASRQERRLCILGLLLIAFYLISPAIRDLACALNASYFRFSSFWISVLILMLGLAGLRRSFETGVWRIGVLLGVSVPIAIVTGAILFLPDYANIEHVVRVVGFVVAYAAILLGGTRPDLRTLSPLTAIVCLELLTFAIAPIINRDAATIDQYAWHGGYEDDTRKAVAFAQNDAKLHGTGFFRIDKTFYSVFMNDALVQGYPGTASYFYHGVSISRFVDGIGLPRVAPSPSYNSSVAVLGRRDVLDLLGVRYVLAHDRNLDSARDMTFVSAVGAINVYRNNSAHTFGHFYDAIASEAQANAVPVPQRDAFMLQHVIVADPAALDKQIVAVRATHAQGLAQQATIRMVQDDLLTGSVQTPNTSTLLLSMPFDRGWTLRVDGQDTETFIADYGLTAAVIPAGKHELVLSYEPPGRAIGKWLSLTAVALLCIPVLRRRIAGTS